MPSSDAEIARLAQEAKSLEESAKGVNAIANLKEALRCYDQILTHCPNIAHYYDKRGGVKFLLTQKQSSAGESYLHSAMADIDKAIELEPDKADYHRIRGLYRLQWLRVRPDKGMSREEAMLAMQDLKACISRDPAQPLVWLHLLVINLVMGAWDEAISVYGQCKPYIHTPDHVLMRSYFGCLALAFAGDVIEEEDLAPLQDETARLKWKTLVGISGPTIGGLFQTEQDETIKGRVKEVIKLFILHEDSWYAKGVYFDELLGNTEEAIKAYDQAIDSGHSIAFAWNNKGWIYKRLRRYEEALDAFNKAAEFNPDFTHPILNRAKVLAQLGRYEEALHAVDRVLAQQPQSANHWVDKSYYLGQLGRHKDALKACSKAIEIDFDNIHAWHNKGWHLENLNKLAKALNCYEYALEIDPDFSLAARNRRNVLRRLKSQTEDEVEAKEAELKSTRAVRELMEKAAQHEKTGNYEDALTTYAKVIAKKPCDAYAWYKKTVCCSYLSRIAEALEASDKYIELRSNEPDAWYLRAMVHLLNGDKDSAISDIGKSIHIDPRYRKKARKEKAFKGLRDNNNFKELLSKESSGVGGFFRNLFKTNK